LEQKRLAIVALAVVQLREIVEPLHRLQ
jgi:hypothetical protein